MTPSRAPERIGYFRILGKLGQGGMGVVYRAEDERLRRQVAIKVLPDAFAADEGRRKRFLREARSAAALTHGNIATVHDVAEDDGHVYIVMELVEGQSLRKRIERGPVPAGETVRIARGIARGLARAHEKGIVHRDLKPENVVLDADGEPKILDFGLAKLREVEHGRSAIEGAETVTQEGHLLGTPPYMSPEQARGDALDARSDVFALGIVLYEMLSGHRPFGGNSAAEVIAAVLRDLPRPIAEVAPETPPALATLVDRCLAKDPSERPAGARELVGALEAISTSGGGDRARSASAIPPSRGRSRSGLVGASLALIVVAVGAGLLARSHRAKEEVSSPQASPTATGSDAGRAAALWATSSTSNPEARALYAEAMQSLFAGNTFRAHTDLLRAVTIDPRFASAFLRLAQVESRSFGRTDNLYLYLERAQTVRSLLDEREQQFLLLAETAQTGDSVTAERLADQLESARPDDPDALAWAAIWAGVREARVRRLRRAFELDPSFNYARAALARVFLLGMPDPNAALQCSDECLARAPAAADCLAMRAEVHNLAGHCDLLEEDAERIMVAQPSDPSGYAYLGVALMARGSAPEALEHALHRAEANMAEGKDRSDLSLQDSAVGALYAGDFAECEARLRDIEQANAEASSEIAHHALYDLYWLYEEEGASTKALAVASEYARKLPAWPLPSGSFAREILFAALRRAGRLPPQVGDASDYGTAGRAPHDPWLTHEAATVESASEASAVAARAPAPDDAMWAYLKVRPDMAGLAGQVFELAGEAPRAVPLLQAEVSWCGPSPRLQTPYAIYWRIHQQRSRLLLGRALEQVGDKAGACEQYGAILSRWGKARPASVTADAARARSKALSCSSGSGSQ